MKRILAVSSQDQIYWIAYAFTKQLASKRLHSVIPVAKKEEDRMTPSPLLEALIEALTPMIHTDMMSFGCYLMLIIVNASMTATDSLDMEQVLNERGISHDSCREYMMKEMNALSQPMESQMRDIRAWQWSICCCLGVHCGVTCSILLRLLVYV